MKISGIYKIVSPVGKIYIGQSVNILNRFSNYKRLSNCKNQMLLFNSFLKYGVLNHTFEIIQNAVPEALDKLEQIYINEFDCLNRDRGLNIREAGSRGKHSEETKKKMSNAKLGKKKSPETIEKMKNYRKENPVNFWLGKKRNENFKIGASQRMMGKVGYKSSSSKKIHQIDLNGNILNTFFGAAEAGRILGISRTAIKNNLTGLSKTCNKTIFVYASDRL